MGFFNNSCSICARRELCETVNRLLSEGLSCKKIARAVNGAASKSSIHRHSQSCLSRPDNLKFEPGDDWFVVYPGQLDQPEMLELIEVAASKLKKNAKLFLLEITYSDPVPAEKIIAHQTLKQAAREHLHPAETQAGTPEN